MSFPGVEPAYALAKPDARCLRTARSPPLWAVAGSMAAEGKQQELERANLEEIVTKIEADTVPAAESCGARLKK